MNKPAVLYADLTDEMRQKILNCYDNALRMGAPIGQAIAIGANDGFDLTDRQWNGKTGTNAFATACAVVLMAGRLGDTEKKVAS